VGRPSPSERSSHRGLLLVAGLVTVVVVAVVVTRATSGRGADRPAVAGAVADRGAAQAAASEESALEAGVALATLMARLYPLEPAAARAVAEDVASDAYRPTLVVAVDAELVPLQRRVADLAGHPVYRQNVLAVRLDSHAPPRATVSAWVMVIAGQAEVDGNAMATFATVTVELAFERGAWRLDGTAEVRGPSPQVGDAPSTVDALVSRLSGFSDWRPRH
jgi:hypothetical protein